MHLSWFGLSAFKVETTSATIVTDPFAPSLSSKPVRAKADIVTVSDRGNPMHNALSGILGSPFVIDVPGEFEVKGVYVQGVELAPFTLFVFDVEGMRLVHAGGTKKPPSNDVLERLGDVDLLFLPVGGGTTLDPEAAAKVVNEVEPRVVVPMHFATPGLNVPNTLLPAAAFLREMGASRVEPVERLSLRKRDLAEEETKVVVFRQ